MTTATMLHPDTNLATPMKRIDLVGTAYSYCERHVHDGDGMQLFLPDGDEPERSETTDKDRALCEANGFPASSTTWTYKRGLFFFFPTGVQVIRSLRVMADEQPAIAPLDDTYKLSVILARKLFKDETLPAVDELNEDDKGFNSLIALGMLAMVASGNSNNSVFEKTFGLEATYVEADIFKSSTEVVMLSDGPDDKTQVAIGKYKVIVEPGAPDPVIIPYGDTLAADKAKLDEASNGTAPDIAVVATFENAALLQEEIRDAKEGIAVLSGKVVVLTPVDCVWTRSREWVPTAAGINKGSKTITGHELADLLDDDGNLRS